MNVSRVYRLLKLITLLRSGRAYDVPGLAENLGVSRRTLFRDLNLLQHAGIPYRFEPAKNMYSISDSFFLPPIHLDLQEAMAFLLVTRKFLSRQVHPVYQKALDAALKVESILPPTVLRHCGDMLDGVSARWPATSPTDAVSDLFRTLQHAVARRLRVKGRYDSVYDDATIDVYLEPLRLIFMARGWYLLANSLTHHQVRTFKTDRFVELTPTEESFEPDPAFNEEDHFGAAWQMIPEGKLYNVKLRFAAHVAVSVEEVRWHASQTTSRTDDGRLLFEATVDGLREICSWVLGYGDQVEVLDPAELRAMIRQKAEGILALTSRSDTIESGDQGF